MRKEPPADESRVVQLPLEEVMHNSMIPYAEHVILERALPRVEDGLKPVQRRILYTMLELSLVPDKPHRKCARIVGDCLGKYHPHGDSSVYDALVRMAQDFTLREKLVDGHGNFGSIDGDTAAAMRYTEARMTPLAIEMLRDLDKDTVSFHLNFDDTLREPDMLPARYPNLLVNGSSGIAVGLATNVPPHNLREAIGAVIAQIDNPDITVPELMKHLPAPDFPTGGVLLDTPELRTAYETGRAKLTLRAKVSIEKGNLGRTLIVITEMPYMVSKAAMLERILKLSEEKKALLGGICDIRDESDRTGLRAVIELKRDVDPHAVLASLYKYSDMQVTFGVNIVAIAEGRPMQLGLRALIQYYIQHQKNVVTRRTRYELDQARARAHVLEGLIRAVDCLDEIIAAIRASKNAKEARERLMTGFGFTEIQAQAILDLRLQRLTGLEILALRREYDDILKAIRRFEGILASEKQLLTVIKSELKQIADEHGSERRTRVESVDANPLPVVDETPLAEEAAVTLTRAGQLRRMQPRVLDKLPPPESAGDVPAYVFRAMTDQTLYLFTNLGNCFTVGVGALQDASRPRDRGTSLAGILAGLKDGERAVSALCATPDQLRAMPDLMFFTRGGLVKRTQAAEYDRRTRSYAAITLKGGDELIGLSPIQPGGDLLLCTRRGMVIRFSEKAVNPMGRATAGVKGIQLDAGDEVVLGAQLAGGQRLLLCSDRGYCKRIPETELEPQGRGGKGVRCVAFLRNGANGTLVAGALLLAEADAFRVVQAHGAMTVMQCGSVPAQSRLDRGAPMVMALMDDVVTNVWPEAGAPAT